MTAEDIIAAAEAVYAQCRTYADHGAVRTVFLSSAGREMFVTNMPFKTAFIRPERFRFEFSSHHPNRSEYHRHIIAANGPLIQTWWDIRPGVEHPESLSLAIAGATGISQGAAHYVPSWLMPDKVSGRRIAEDKRLTRMADGDLEGVACYRVERRDDTDPGESSRLVEEATQLLGCMPPQSQARQDVWWFEHGTLLLRKIEGRQKLPDFAAAWVIDYKPAIDQDISGEQLAFNVP